MLLQLPKHVAVNMWSPPRPMNLGEKEELIHKTKCCHLRIFTFSIKTKMCISFGKDRSKLKLFKDVFLRPQMSILSLSALTGVSSTSHSSAILLGVNCLVTPKMLGTEKSAFCPEPGSASSDCG